MSSNGSCYVQQCKIESSVVHRKGASLDEFHNWIKLPTSGHGPSPRSGHDVVVIGNRAYLFGGCGGDVNDHISCLNDVYVFNLDTHKWNMVAAEGDMPLPRASFGMCAGPRPDTIIIAGGTGVQTDSLRTDIVEFDTRNRTWRTLVTDSEDTPCRFYGQSLCIFGESLLIFGGSTGMHYTNDLYEYNLRTLRWRKLVTYGNKPSPRYKHQAIVANRSMYIIGGGCFKPEHNFIDVHRLDLDTLYWHEVRTKGHLPKSRVAHSCSYDQESNTIYLWGGFTSELSRLQDFFLLKSGVWRAIHPYRHRLGNSGVHQEESGMGRVEVELPPARAFHAATFHNGSLYLFNGANGDLRYNDVWRYQIRSHPPDLAMLAARALRNKEKNLSGENFLECVPHELAQAILNMNDYSTKLI